MNVIKQYYNVESPILHDTIDKFLTFLGGLKDFPLTKQELLEYIEHYKVLNLETNNLESLAREVYQFIYNFFIKIQHYIYEGDNNNK